MSCTLPEDIILHPATKDDALCLSVLAIQVFLDTYATVGIQPDLAREVLNYYSPKVFEERLNCPTCSFIIAEKADHIIGFIETESGTKCPKISTQNVLEVARLYNQRPFLHKGIGRVLLTHAENIAVKKRKSFFWLPAWSGNSSALSFHKACGYSDIGNTNHVIEGISYENRLLVKTFTEQNG